MDNQPADPFRLDVEAGKVREFRIATRNLVPPGVDGEAESSLPTFLMTAAFWRSPRNEVLTHAEFYERSLHATEEFVFPDGPPRAGCTLVGQSRIGETTTKIGRRGGNMTFTEVITEFRDAAGALVCHNVSTTVIVENPPH